MDVEKMNLEELQVAVAELMGWYYIHEDEFDPFSAGYWTHSDDRSGNICPPDYPTHISDAYQVEERIEELGLKEVYIKSLITLMDDPGPYYDQLFALVHATPEDKCRAAVAARIDDES